MIAVLGMSIVLLFSSEAKAQYNYFGGGWDFCCSYRHTMTYAGVKGSDFKDSTIFFVSGTVWYDNAQSCCVGNNCKNEPLAPGIGHFTLGGSVTPALDALCAKRGKCTGAVVYPSSVEDLEGDENKDLLDDCRAAVCANHPELGDCSSLTPQLCFNWLFFESAAGGHCRNRNDTVVRVSTKGVCTTATPQTCVCTDPNDLSTCSGCVDQNNPVGVRYTFPSFDQKPGDSFAQQRDDRCIACVAGTGPCEP
jgi:hypothetical protein